MAAPRDVAALTELLGREPRVDFDVVVRNAPFTVDGTPMPTRYWLVDRDAVVAVSRLEAAGGVRAAASDVDPVELAATHRAYATERDTAIPVDHVGPRPSGGVGGTRTGVKCLHAHFAYLLAGGDDPVGRWVASRVSASPNQEMAGSATPKLDGVGA